MTEQSAEDDSEGPTAVEEMGFEHAMSWHGDAEKVAREWAEQAKTDGDLVGHEWWLHIAAFSADFWALNKEKIERMTFHPDENVDAQSESLHTDSLLWYRVICLTRVWNG